MNKDQIKSSSIKVKWLMSELIDYVAARPEFFDQGPDSVVFNATKEQIKERLMDNIKDCLTKTLISCFQASL